MDNNTKFRRNGFRPRNERPAEMSENVIYGRNAVIELLKTGRSVNKIFIKEGEREGSLKLIGAQAAERGIPLVQVTKSRLDELAQDMQHQGVVAMAAERDYCTVDEILDYARQRQEKPLIVIADGIEDPQNLGALIRTAECAGAHGIIIPKRRSVGLTGATAKASAGAIEHIRIARVTNLAATVDELKEKGLWIYAAEVGGIPYTQADLSGAVAIVLGSEGFGVSRLIREKSDYILSIPMYGQVNSLNVSTAASVLLFEAAKQHH